MAAPTEQQDPAQSKRALVQQAMALGFDAIGVAPPELEPTELAHHRSLLDAGCLDGLAYLRREPERRYTAQELLPGCASVIVLGLSYFHDSNASSSHSSHPDIARYAQGKDYHGVLRVKTQLLADWMERSWGSMRYKITVDTSPISEKAYAVAAGLGWRGRNTLVLNRQLGSYFFLACLLTDLPLPPDTITADACGSCQRCLDACPTQALGYPGWLDVRKCISYWTTATEADLPHGLSTHGWLFGCDICQQVCPFNAAPRQSREPRFSANPALKKLCDADLGTLSDIELKELLNGSVMATVNLRRLRSIAEQCQTERTE